MSLAKKYKTKQISWLGLDKKQIDSILERTRSKQATKNHLKKKKIKLHKKRANRCWL
jgi:hypothetical protein